MQQLWNWDLNVFKAIHLGLKSPFLDALFAIISHSGYGDWQILFLIILFSDVRYKLRLAKLRNPYRFWFWPLLGAWATSGVINAILKNTVVRDRPSNLSWTFPAEAIHHDSFVSGHTTTSFGIAVCLLFLTLGRREVRWGYAALGWATLVGISRIYRGVHWPTDIIAGALIGIFCGTLISFLWHPEPVFEPVDSTQGIPSDETSGNDDP